MDRAAPPSPAPPIPPAPRRSAWITAVLYLLAGAVVYVAVHGVPGASEGPEVEAVEISDARQRQLRADFRFHNQRSPSPAEMKQLVDDAIVEELLIGVALDRGLMQRDPILERRLAALARFALAPSTGPLSDGPLNAGAPGSRAPQAVSPQAVPSQDGQRGTATTAPEASEKTDSAQLATRALELGLHRRDPVARDRLMLLARVELSGGEASFQRTFSDAELQEYQQRHQQEQIQPPRVRIEHVVFVGADAAERAAAWVPPQDPTVSAPADAGDPTPQPRAFPWLTTRKLGQRFGTAFETGLDKALEATFGDDAAGETNTGTVPRWTGPLPSEYGVHRVRIVEARPAGLPPLDEAREQLAVALREEVRNQDLKRSLEQFRERADIVVEAETFKETAPEPEQEPSR